MAMILCMTSMLYKNVSGMYLYTEVNNSLGSNYYIICPQYVSCCSTLVSTGILKRYFCFKEYYHD